MQLILTSLKDICWSNYFALLWQCKTCKISQFGIHNLYASSPFAWLTVLHAPIILYITHTDQLEMVNMMLRRWSGYLPMQRSKWSLERSAGLSIHTGQICIYN